MVQILKIPQQLKCERPMGNQELLANRAQQGLGNRALPDLWALPAFQAQCPGNQEAQVVALLET